MSTEANKDLSWQFMACFRIAEGKIIEQCESINFMEIIQQLKASA